MNMKTRGTARSILILTIVGTLVSAQQASAESVFTERKAETIEALAVHPILPAEFSSPAAGSCALSLSALRADTIETFDVQVDEEKGPGIGKELAVFAIITAVVGYAVIELMKPENEPVKPQKPGKPIP
jgi:hypothetical protein